MLHVLENVRTTHSGRSSRTRSSAVQSANWAYASSTTTSPGATSSSSRTIDGSSTSPVGLFGEHRNVTAGRAASTTRRASTGSSVKSAARSPSTTVAPVIRAMWACSWYVGSNVTTDRPGPAYVSSSVWSTSLEPLAAKTWSGRTPCQSAIAVRSPVASAVGVAPPVDRRHRRGQLVPPRGRWRERRLVGVQPHLDVDLGRVVALERPQVVAHGHGVGGRHHGWRRYWRAAIVGS